METRTPLRALNPNSQNRRLSFAAHSRKNVDGRHSLVAPATRKLSVDRRLSSLAPPGRRNSIRRHTLAPVRAQAPSRTSLSRFPSDPRPLKVKSYMHACMKNLVQFLTANGYLRPISLKVLQNPTSNDYFGIVEYMYSKVDPNFQFSKKWQDDLPMIFRLLKYPFAINKSSLVAVGSPHTWPALLGSITWLMELLVYDEVKTEILETTTAVDGSEKVFFDYVAKAYKAFLLGEDDFEELENELAGSLKQKNEEMKEEIEKITDENTKLRKELEKLEKDSNRVQRELQTQDNLNSDIAKFQSLIESLEGHTKSLVKRVEEFTSEMESKEMELQKIQEEKSQIAVILEEQERQNIDAERINTERRVLEEQLQQTVGHKENIKKQIWSTETAISKKLDETEQSVQLYNSTAVILKLSPITAKNACGVNYECRFNPNGTTATAMTGIDLKGKIKPAMSELKDWILTKTDDIHASLFSLREELDRNEELVSDKKHEVSQGQEQLERLQQAYKSQKENFMSEIRQMESEAESIRRDTQLRKQESVSDYSRSQKSLELLQQQLEQQHDKFETEKELLNNQVLNAVDKLLNHKATIQAILTAVEEQYGTMLRKVQQPN